MDICRTTNTESVIMVNVQSHKKPGTTITYDQLLTNAVEWVKYANINKNYGIKYWEIGNEVDIDDGKYLTKQEYLNLLIEFGTEMKKIDPSIKVGAGVAFKQDWFNFMVENGVEHFDFMIPHIKTGPFDSYQEYKENNWKYISRLEQTIDAIDQYAPEELKNKIEILLTEANLAPSPGNNLHGALMTFELLSNSLTEDKRFTYAHYWPTNNPWNFQLDVLDALDAENQLTAIGKSVQLIALFIQPDILNVSRVSKYIRSYASVNSEENILSIMLVNKNDDVENISLNLLNYNGAERYEQWEFTGDSPADQNPELSLFAVRDYDGNIELKPHSVTVLNFKDGLELMEPPVPTSIPEILDTNTEFMLYPNPASGFIIIDKIEKSINPKKISVQIFGTNGSLLQETDAYILSEKINVKSKKKESAM
ncbi:MAG: hypothetical protein ACOCVN_00105 [bacterium]